MSFISGYEWQYATLFVGAVILAAGFWTNRNLSSKKKKDRIQKFACAALIPIALMLLFTKPVSFIPKSSLFIEQKFQNPTSGEEIANYEKNQTRNIEYLNEEVEILKENFNEANNYYGTITHALLGAVIVFCFTRIMRKEDENLEAENKSN